MSERSGCSCPAWCDLADVATGHVGHHHHDLGTVRTIDERRDVAVFLDADHDQMKSNLALDVVGGASSPAVRLTWEQVQWLAGVLVDAHRRYAAVRSQRVRSLR
jgi:hypothetical protein